MYSGYYKILLKEVKGYLNKCKDILRSGIGRLATVKMAVLPQIDPQMQYNSCQNPSCHFCRNFQADLNIHMEIKGLRVAKQS